MENAENKPNEANNEGKTFTQDDVNRIVQERLAAEKSKGNKDIEARSAELDARERKLNAIQKFRENDIPDYMVDAVNLSSDEAFEKSLELITKMKEEGAKENEPLPVGTINPIGCIGSMGGSRDSIANAFGIKR